MTEKLEVAVPEIIVEEVVLNENNPFKKTVRWQRLKCKLCGEVALGRLISNRRDWHKVWCHLYYKHHIDAGEEPPVRLLSRRLFRSWLQQELKKVKR